MDRWSNKKVSEDDIRTTNNTKLLIGVVLDQQFDYWYDPCGKSGHELVVSLTRRSRNALRRLKQILWHGERVDQGVLDRVAEAARGEPLSPDQMAIGGAAAIAANALYFDDDSDYKSALYRIVRTLSPEALKRLDDGTYHPDMMPDEPLGD